MTVETKRIQTSERSLVAPQARGGLSYSCDMFTLNLFVYIYIYIHLFIHSFIYLFNGAISSSGYVALATTD